MIVTYKYRIKDATTGKHLVRHAWACNQVWNFCCQIQRQSEDKWRSGLTARWPTAFDLTKLCAGGPQELGILSDTISAICHQFVVARNARRGCPKFRSSSGSRRSLGWVPFYVRTVKIKADSIKYRNGEFRFWQSRPIDGIPKSGSFIQDARGRWYVCLQCEVADDLHAGNGRVGIDLGLKTLATLSDGSKIEAIRHYQKYATALAVAQRAGNKRRARAIHAKIANARRHHLHERTTELVRNNQFIAVGNVSPSKLAKTRMAKSILDASWAMLKAQLCYKARRHNAVFIEVDECFTSQTCSCCGTIPDSSPKGMGALGIRSWECSNCGAEHDRDRNAAINILRIGLERQAPGEGIPAKHRKDVKQTLRGKIIATPITKSF